MSESSAFDNHHWRYISLLLPIPTDIPNLKSHFATNQIRIALLDSPPDADSQSATAAMIVPRNREADWIFSTEAGQIQLLLSAPGVSRLILIGNAPPDEEFSSYTKPEGDSEDFLQKSEESVYPFLLRFLPKRGTSMEDFHIIFLRYEDNLIYSVVLDRFVGPVVGEMLIEDVEIEDRSGREFRRRLRFKRMPNLIQTEIKLIPYPDPDSDSLLLQHMKFQLDLSDLVHVYLAPMAASLSLVSLHLQDLLNSRIRPKALCIGVGGGSLIGFLATELDFDVVGVEIDQLVLNTAKQYFGLEQCEKSVTLVVGDGIEFLKCYDSEAKVFDVIMVDLDPGDFSDSVPPWKFQSEGVILAAKNRLCGAGVLVLNVIPVTNAGFENLVARLRAEFAQVYKIDAGNGENCIVVAMMAAVDVAEGVPENAFMAKMRSKKPGEFLGKIEKI